MMAQLIAQENIPILVVRDLHVQYGKQIAVAGVNFEIYPGEIFGLLGPNGAGKTTTLSAIEGLLEPNGGFVEVAGVRVIERPLEARANMGIQLQATSFHQDLTVHEIIELYAGLYGLNLSKERIDAVISDIELHEDADKKTAQLSGGQQQRVALATATLHNPPLLLLDEPTTGLDPQSRRHLWDRIEEMRNNGKSIVLTTHSMEEARAICDRVAIMDHGRILVIGGPQDLIEYYRNDPDVQAVARRGEVTLEDVFIGLTGRAIRS